MDGIQRLTLRDVFAEPAPPLEWAAIEDLLTTIGCRVVQVEGQRVTFELDGMIGSFERPKPGMPVPRYIVRAVRDYLKQVGAAP